MAIAVVQSQAVTTAGSPVAGTTFDMVTSFANTPTVGNLLAMVMVQAGSGSGNTYGEWNDSRIVYSATGIGIVAVKVVESSQESKQFGVRVTGSSTMRAWAGEISGLDTTLPPLDQVGSGGPATVNTFTPTTPGNLAVNNEFCLIAIGNNGGQGDTETFTNSYVLDQGTNTRRIYAIRTVTTGAGATQSSVVTWTTSVGSQWIIATFQGCAPIYPYTPQSKYNPVPQYPTPIRMR